MNDKVKAAHQNIQRAVSDEALRLTASEYRQLLEELLADADGWKMLLEEEEGDEE